MTVAMPCHDCCNAMPHCTDLVVMCSRLSLTCHTFAYCSSSVPLLKMISLMFSDSAQLLFDSLSSSCTT